MDTPTRLVDAALDTYGRIDLLVYNVGISPYIGPLHEVDRDRFVHTVVVNTWAGVGREALVVGLPDPRRPAVVHGDYRLGNMLCSGDEVQAIIDWEIWALTDPRIDLAWMLMFCHRREQPPAVRDAPGMPDAVTLRRVYAEAAGIPVDAPEWFDAFVRFKQAATALLVKRRRKAAVDRGHDPGPVSPTPRLLITRGLELLGVPTG